MIDGDENSADGSAPIEGELVDEVLEVVENLVTLALAGVSDLCAESLTKPNLRGES